MDNRYGSAFTTPPVVLNLLILNILFFMAEALLPNGMGERIIDTLGLYAFQSDNFCWYQLVTHMFLHANLAHLFTNMFAFWMFGRSLEYDMGSRRFLVYYMMTGLGAALLHLGVISLEIHNIMASAGELGGLTPELGRELAMRLNTVTIGASGAVFGVLLAFGMLHPNVPIFIFFIPIPIKAKYFVIGYGLLELYMGFTGNQSGIAHFAHIGGMLFGFLLLVYWKKKRKIYY